MSKRLESYPQMNEYDQMASGEPAQYSMLTGPKNYNSKKINTDKNGFRNTFFKNQIVNSETAHQFSTINVILGGSTVFVVGSDDDRTTIPSYLSAMTNEPWLNLGVRGCNSFQEIIYFLQTISFLNKINNVIFFSGANDSFIDILKSEDIGCDRQVNEIPLKLYQVSKKRLVIVLLLAMLKGVQPEKLVELSLKQMIFFKEDSAVDEEFVFNFSRLEKNTNRNFRIYSAFRSKCSGQVQFFLQPFFPWTGKEASEKESVTFQELDQLQESSDWLKIKPIISNKENYKKIQSLFSQAAYKNEIQFLDTNSFFSSTDSYFVDSVHLTSQGCQLAAKLIVESLSKKVV